MTRGAVWLFVDFGRLEFNDEKILSACVGVEDLYVM